MMLAWVLSAKAFGLYTPTPEDATLIASLENKVDTIYSTSPQKIEAIWEKLSRSVLAFSKETQAGYILRELSWIIEKQLHVGKKPNDRSAEMISVIAQQFD